MPPTHPISPSLGIHWGVGWEFLIPNSSFLIPNSSFVLDLGQGEDPAAGSAFSTNTTWYGHAKMIQALAEIKELDQQMRKAASAS